MINLLTYFSPFYVWMGLALMSYLLCHGTLLRLEASSSRDDDFYSEGIRRVGLSSLVCLCMGLVDLHLISFSSLGTKFGLGLFCFDLTVFLLLWHFGRGHIFPILMMFIYLLAMCAHLYLYWYMEFGGYNTIHKETYMFWIFMFNILQCIIFMKWGIYDVGKDFKLSSTRGPMERTPDFAHSLLVVVLGVPKANVREKTFSKIKAS